MFTPFTLYRILLFNISLSVKECKIAGWVTTSVDPDKRPRSVASDHGLHCLLGPVCLSEYVE